MATSHQLIQHTALASPEHASDLSLADDVELALALRAGSKDAPRVTWRRFAPLVRRILVRSLGPERDVEDTVQDVFLCVFDKARTLRNPGSLRAFIVSVTVRSLRHEIRRRKLRSWLRLDGDAETPDLRTVDVDTDGREALERFYRILNSINTRDRTAFVLHFIEGMSIPEIAEGMGISAPTVRRCLVRSREKLTRLAGRDPVLVEYASELEQEGSP